MPSHSTSRSDAPVPHETLTDEGGCTTSWCAADWTKERICEEHDWLDLTPEKLTDVWMGCRWTTPEELADEDELSLLFGDHESNGIDTSVVYWVAKPNAPGAHLYWTSEG